MSNDVIIPDLPGGPAAIFQEKSVHTESLSDGIDGLGFGLIHFKGKEFYVRHQGVKKTIVKRGEDGYPSPVNAIEFVILRKGARKSHTWYEGGYDQESAGKRPTCVSTDGIAPDDASEKKQSTLCDICPRYEWRKDLGRGKGGRECSDSLRLAILPVSASIAETLGVAITEPVLFRIPAGSLQGFATLGSMLEQRYNDAPFCSFILRVSFIPGFDYPKYEYKITRWLSAQEAQGVLELREHPTAYRILGTTPQGRSLVRREKGQVGVMPVTQIQAPANDEPAPLIKTIDVTAEEVIQDNVVPMKKNEPLPVDDAPPSIDALVAAMRPRPPGA